MRDNHWLCYAISAQIFALVPIIAVMFTFSFGSAFAAVPYGEEASKSEPVAEKSDFTGEGTFGISTVSQKACIAYLEAVKDDEAGKYPVALQAKVDAAYDTAIAAVKAAKTAKEMDDATTALRKALEGLKVDKYSYGALAEAADKAGLELVYTVGEDEGEYYAVPDWALIVTGEGGKVAVANDKNDDLFRWLMDQGYYGYLDGKWDDVLLGKAVKSEVADFLADYYVGEYTFNEVQSGDAKTSQLEKYGRKVYAEYLDVIETVEAWKEKKTTTIDEFAAVLEKLEAYDAKYGFSGDFATAPEIEEADLNKLYIAVDKWYIANLEDAVEAIEKINTAAGYTAAKADIIAAAKKCFDVVDKYGLTSDITELMLFDNDAAETIGEALLEVIGTDTKALKEAFDDFEEIKYLNEEKTVATFDSSEDNLAAIAAARKAFDAYVADYTFAYEGVFEAITSTYVNNQDPEVNVATIEDLVADETKLLAAEYNKTAVPAEAAKIDAATAAKVQAWLNNATVKVTTKALGNGKIRVQATVDTASFAKILAAMDDECTVTYKFYKKTANATKFKGYSDRAVNYTTFTKLTKGTKYNFKCAITISDKDGNVIATKSYLGSTTGIRTAK